VARWYFASGTPGKEGRGEFRVFMAMSIEEYPIRLATQSGQTIPAVVVVDEEESAPCRLVLRTPGGDVRAEATDYFEAFCHIRRRLEQEGLRPLCYGASRGVYPSGMARDMGGGALRAFKLNLGQPALMRDLVFIFDAGPDVDPVTVEEQLAYYEAWLSSLSRR
jgi:hypothetical protein